MRREARKKMESPLKNLKTFMLAYIKQNFANNITYKYKHSNLSIYCNNVIYYLWEGKGECNGGKE